MKRAFSKKNIWEAMPGVVKTTAGHILKRVPQQYLLGSSFRKHLAFARESQWWSAERARAYQLERLREICSLAYEKTVFYRAMFDAAGFQPGDLRTVEDLAKLPTIDKRTVLEHLDEMCSVDPAANNVDYVSTGGSSGNPLHFYVGPDRSAVEYAFLVAGWEHVGYRLSIPQAVFRGQIVSPDRRGLRHEYDPVLRRHYYSNFHMNDEQMARYMDHVSTIGPCYLHVYPSSVATLAKFLVRKGRTAPANVVGVLAGSECVYPEDRELVEQVFGRRYYSWYGHSEKLVLATECEHTTDYHVWPTYGYFELLDENGTRITKPGDVGEIVGTGFINRVCPFIRYRTGDLAVYGGDRCSACGREHSILKNIAGRWSQGSLIAEDGARISMTALNVHDDTFEAIMGYQFFQDTPGEATLRLVPSRPLAEHEQQCIVKRTEERLQGQVRLNVEIREKLEKTHRGKQLWIIQRIVKADKDQKEHETGSTEL